MFLSEVICILITQLQACGCIQIDNYKTSMGKRRVLKQHSCQSIRKKENEAKDESTKADKREKER
jgi:hypothetical protein